VLQAVNDSELCSNLVKGNQLHIGEFENTNASFFCCWSQKYHYAKNFNKPC